MPQHIRVVGAGVSGLTTALLLAKTGNYKVTIIAEHMPGDTHIRYASPVAGANYLPVSTPGTANNRYERATWPVLEALASQQPEAGIHFQDCYVYRRAKDLGSPTGDWMKELAKEDAWFKDLVPNFRVLQKDELPLDIDGGSTFTSVCINTALYLPWLASECLKHGVQIRRHAIKHIIDAASPARGEPQIDLVINCTGLSSLQLGGVEDQAMFPGRGQITLVSNVPGRMLGTSGTDDSPEELTYIMCRAAGGGTVLGGCYQAGSWDDKIDLELAERVMRRSIELCPQLDPERKGTEGLNVIRHVVGLRPMRKNGIRVEQELISDPSGKSIRVVHNYGHGGYGYQCSYGAAQEVVHLVDSALIVAA